MPDIIGDVPELEDNFHDINAENSEADETSPKLKTVTVSYLNSKPETFINVKEVDFKIHPACERLHIKALNREVYIIANEIIKVDIQDQ